MNSREAASLALKRAEVILSEAESLRAKEVWNLVVRRAQEGVELALKGALLWAGLAVPWVLRGQPGFVRRALLVRRLHPLVLRDL